MKKFLFLHIFAILLPYCLGAMNMQRMLRIPSGYKFQKRSYSTNNSPKLLGALSFPEVQKLAYNKEFAHKELKSALFRYEDVKTTPTFQQSPDIENLWKKSLNQFSIKDWNSMLLEREENAILGAINPALPNLLKLIKVKEHKNTKRDIKDLHKEAKQFYNAQPLDESLQQYYQQNLHAAGHSKIPTMYQWNNHQYKPACSIYPNTYLTSDFFDLPLEERLAILAHENEHAENLHQHKWSIVSPFLEEQTDTYSQFQEKEADLKASAHNLTIANGLLQHFKKNLKETEKLENSYFSIKCLNFLIKRLKRTHPLWSERIDYTKSLIGKLEQEQKGYSWNPFYKTLGLREWIKHC